MNIRFDNIVNELNISNATLQNWIKTNYLISVKKGFITKESYQYFKKNILGKNKLNKRANKQHLNDAVAFFDVGQNSNAHKNAVQYEQSLSTSDKNKKGIYYTPDSVIDEMFLAMSDINENDTFLDPCCGTGNFLIKALKKGVNPENIYGFDIDEISLKIANERFYQTTGFYSNNIKTLNLLEESHNQKYDFIFTNPPWGYKFTIQQKIIYANKFNNGIKVDSSAFFVLICLNILQKNGYFGVLLPDSFFNISAFKSVRKKVLEKTLIKLINHDRPFDGLQTKAYSFIVRNNSNLTSVECRTKIGSYARKQTDFNQNPNYIINFDITQSEAEVISHLYLHQHQTLVDKATWGMGIVTGNNSKHLSEIQNNGYNPICKGTDIEKGKIKKPKFYIDDDFSKLQQTADKNLYLVDKKIVYRFISSNLIFALDNNKRYFLNSANFFILNQQLQITSEQLVFLMNTKIMNWLFQKLFNTHKVLRSDLEKLPIFNHFFQENSGYCEQTLNEYLKIEKNNGTFSIKK